MTILISKPCVQGEKAIEPSRKRLWKNDPSGRLSRATAGRRSCPNGTAAAAIITALWFSRRLEFVPRRPFFPLVVRQQWIAR